MNAVQESQRTDYSTGYRTLILDQGVRRVKASEYATKLWAVSVVEGPFPEPVDASGSLYRLVSSTTLEGSVSRVAPKLRAMMRRRY